MAQIDPVLTIVRYITIYLKEQKENKYNIT